MKKLLLTILICLFAGSAWGTDYYVDASAVDDTGDGSQGSPKKYIASGVGLCNGSDTVYVAAGNYSPSASIFWPAGTGDSLLGATENPDDVLIDLSGVDSNYFIRLATTSQNNTTIKYLTFYDYDFNGNGVIQGDGNLGLLISQCVFTDNNTNLYIYALSANTIIERCVFNGDRDAAQTMLLDANNTTIRSCVFRSSLNYNMKRIRLNDTGGGGFTYSFYNNYYSGTDAGGIYIHSATAVVDIKNNIFLGHGINSWAGSYAIYGNTDNTTVAYNNILPAQSDLQVQGAASETNGVDKNPRIKGHSRYGILILGVDDRNHWDYFYSTVRPALNTKNWDGTFWSTVSGLDNITVPTAEIAQAVSEGHDIQLHSHSHPYMSERDAIDWTGPANATITISFDIRPADLSGGQDYSAKVNGGVDTWTITVDCEILDVSEAGFPHSLQGAELSDVTGWIDALAGWTADLTADAYKTFSKAGVLADVTDSTASLAVDEDAMHWVEVTEAKYDLEQYVGTAIGSSYTVTGWASPYNDSDDALRERLKADGFLIARAGLAADTDGEAWNLGDLSIFKTKYHGSGYIKNVDNSPKQETIDGLLAASAEVGGLMTSFFHDDDVTYNDFDAAEWLTYVGYIAAYVETGDIIVMPQSDAAVYIRANFSCVDAGDSNACDGATTAVNERWQATFTDGFDGRLAGASPCINEGTNWPLGLGADVYDLDNKQVWGGTGNVALGAWLDGAEIGAYGYFQSGAAGWGVSPWGQKRWGMSPWGVSDRAK